MGRKLTLPDITNREQLEAYYQQEGLDTASKKVKHLKDGMRILAMGNDHSSDDEELLVGLEDYLFDGVWKAYANRRNKRGEP